MVPINNSDTAWLIVSDYNQENGKFYNELRKDIANPNVNDWIWEYFEASSSVGSYSDIEMYVGHIRDVILNVTVGGGYGGVGGGFVISGNSVGGHDPY